MKVSQPLWIVVQVLHLLQCVLSYSIDAGCKEEESRLIQNGMKGAMRFARAGLAAADTGPGKDHYDAFKRVKVDLFGDEDYANEWVKKKFDRISQYGDYVADKKWSDLTDQDIMFYCDERRIQPPKVHDRKVRIVDGDSGVFHEGLGEAWPTCYEPTLAYTVTMDPRQGQRGADQITVCPWFLAYALKKKFKTLVGTDTSSGLISTFVGELAAKKEHWALKLGYTEIDLVAIVEKLILHEMTHTRSGGWVDDPWGLNSYGYKNCMSHAKDRVLRSTTIGEEKENPPKDPRHNADGFALFGSSIVAPSRHYITYWISKGYTFTDDWKLEEPIDKNTAVGGSSDQSKEKGKDTLEQPGKDEKLNSPKDSKNKKLESPRRSKPKTSPVPGLLKQPRSLGLPKSRPEWLLDEEEAAEEEEEREGEVDEVKEEEEEEGEEEQELIEYDDDKDIDPVIAEALDFIFGWGDIKEI